MTIKDNLESFSPWFLILATILCYYAPAMAAALFFIGLIKQLERIEQAIIKSKETAE